MGLAKYRQKRHFNKTAEPQGTEHSTPTGQTFVIQKHAASHLHYDFRLEMEGVLRSWAVPKGPSFDPQDKRLAVQVEDHPIEYGEFEGVIPQGEYGGGTVMLWDRGHWTPEPGADPVAAWKKGRLRFTLQGEKLQGTWSLVKTSGGDGRNWLLIKSRDETARNSSDNNVTEELDTSVATRRTMEEIAQSRDRVWNSNRNNTPEQSGELPTSTPAPSSSSPSPSPSDPLTSVPNSSAPAPIPAPSPTKPALSAPKSPMPKSISPQLATLVKVAPTGNDWIHEIKLDGYRSVAYLIDRKVKLITRNGNDWTDRFTVLAEAIRALPVKQAILDGEIVAIDRHGATDFQTLQNAMDAQKARASGSLLVYVAFDLLYLDGYDLRPLPLIERKNLLQRLLTAETVDDTALRYSEHFEGDGAKLLGRACTSSLEGIISKRRDTPYVQARTESWVKTKCVQRQEFIIGGYTDPAGARDHFGALLVGVRDETGQLRYSGKVGTGFTAQSLASLSAKLQPLAQKSPPFADPPKGAPYRTAHWVRPDLVAEIEFTEWTADRKLRHPSFQGLREDKSPNDVIAEKPKTLTTAKPSRPTKPTPTKKSAKTPPQIPATPSKTSAAPMKKSSPTTRSSTPKNTSSTPTDTPATKTSTTTKTSATKATTKTASSKSAPKTSTPKSPTKKATTAKLSSPKHTITQSSAIPSASPTRTTAASPTKSTPTPQTTIAGVPLTNPTRILYPEQGLTKLDLARYYETIAPHILPHILGRPLTLIRCPAGRGKNCFIQRHQQPDTDLPQGVIKLDVPGQPGGPKTETFLGVTTVAGLISLVQLGTLEFHVWGAPAAEAHRPDRLILDLDPAPDLPWEAVVQAAKEIRKILQDMGLIPFLKTTGGKGLHIVTPITPGPTWDQVRDTAEAIARDLSARHPDRYLAVNTKSKRTGRIFLDYARNARTASIIAPYSTRAREQAPVSMPITWQTLTRGIHPLDYTTATVPQKLKSQKSDPWQTFNDSRRNLPTPTPSPKLK